VEIVRVVEKVTNSFFEMVFEDFPYLAVKPERSGSVLWR
jgi:hypothetical protein